MADNNMTTDGARVTMDHTGLVLVVDDDRKNRTLLKDVLEAQGHQVLEARSGHEALQKVSDAPPDVVLLDVMMPQLDGYEVCRRLKEDPRTAAISILLVTALTEREDRLKGIESGANDFLVKPVDTRDLVLRVRNAVHLKHLHDQLQRSYEQLQHLEKLRDDLTHLVVHDMKTPLGSISGYLELLEMQAKDKLTGEELDFLTEARDATRRLLDMAVALLDVSRLEENEMPLERQRRNLIELAQEAAHQVAFAARQKEIQWCLPAEDATVCCDPVIIRRVMVNMLENAIKFAPEGGEVALTIQVAEGQVKVAVRDNGPGIPAEHHQRIFEKFGQVELRQERKLYSTGLGLAFCRLAVEAHGGTIGVDSAEGQGTTIWFTLPAEE